MTTIAVVQARMGSTRLAGKVLMDIAGRPMIEHVLRRVKAAPGIDRVILSVYDTPEEKPLRDWWQRLPTAWCWLDTAPGVRVGDVLGRFFSAAGGYRLDDAIARITGDCPLIDPMLISRAVREYQACGGGDVFLDASEAAGSVDGLDVEVFSVAMLLDAHAAATDLNDRAHVTPWMKRNLDHRGAGQQYLLQPGHLPPGARTKWSVDTQEDLDFVRDVYAALGPGLWGYPAVLDYLKRKAAA